MNNSSRFWAQSDLGLLLHCFASFVLLAPFATALVHLVVVVARLQTLGAVTVIVWLTVNLILTLLVVPITTSPPYARKGCGIYSKAPLILGLTVAALAAMTSINASSIRSLGDWPNVENILKSLRFSGPYGLSPFEHVNIPGPPYPMGSLYLVHLISLIIPKTEVVEVAIHLNFLYANVLPTLALYSLARSRKFGQTHNALIVTCCLWYGAIMQSPIELGNLASTTAVTSAVYGASIFSSATPWFRQHRQVFVITYIAGCLLLMDIHPSGVITMIFFTSLANFSRRRNDVYVLTFALATIFLAYVTFASRTSRLLTDLYGIQLNESFEISTFSDFYQRMAAFVWNNIATLRSQVWFVGLIGSLVAFALSCSLRHSQKFIVLKVVVAITIVLSTAVGGIRGILGVPKILSIAWLSSPARAIHLLTVTMFLVTIHATSLSGQRITPFALLGRRLKTPAHVFVVLHLPAITAFAVCLLRTVHV